MELNRSGCQRRSTARVRCFGVFENMKSRQRINSLIASGCNAPNQATGPRVRTGQGISENDTVWDIADSRMAHRAS